MTRGSRLAAFGAGVAFLAMAGSALAVEGYSTAHLNLRTGPGTQYPVIGVMEYNVRTEITGCLADYSWCSVSVAGLNGWASAEYLVVDKGGEVMQITGEDSGIPVVEADVEAVVAPATVGVLVGPQGNVAAIVPEPVVVDYIAATPVDPFALEGEVVVGAVVPQEVTLYEVPNAAYGYAILNGVKVLVDPSSRAIVYIYRA
jgi:uncharacterized protein YraI